MKNNNIDYQLNFRLDSIGMEKLNSMCQQSGLNRSQLLRNLIEGGNVNVQYDRKNILREVANVHNDFNQCSLHVMDSIQQLRNEIDDLKLIVQYDNAELIKIHIAKSEMVLKHIQASYQLNKEWAEKAVDEYVNF